MHNLYFYNEALGDTGSPEPEDDWKSGSESLLPAYEESFEMEAREYPEQQAIKKRRKARSTLSCEPCRRRKIKCDRNLSCLRCEKRGVECFWGPHAIIEELEGVEATQPKTRRRKPVKKTAKHVSRRQYYTPPSRAVSIELPRFNFRDSTKRLAAEVPLYLDDEYGYPLEEDPVVDFTTTWTHPFPSFVAVTTPTREETESVGSSSSYGCLASPPSSLDETLLGDAPETDFDDLFKDTAAFSLPSFQPWQPPPTSAAPQMFSMNSMAMIF